MQIVFLFMENQPSRKLIFFIFQVPETVDNKMFILKVLLSVSTSSIKQHKKKQKIPFSVRPFMLVFYFIYSLENKKRKA